MESGEGEYTFVGSSSPISICRWNLNHSLEYSEFFAKDDGQGTKLQAHLSQYTIVIIIKTMKKNYVFAYTGLTWGHNDYSVVCTQV
jgi:hypothetical protein